MPEDEGGEGAGARRTGQAVEIRSRELRCPERGGSPRRAGLKIDPVATALALWRGTHRDRAFSLAGGGKRLQAETGEDVPVKIGTRWELGLRYKLQILGVGPGPVL
jgi:hypothetical protein